MADCDPAAADKELLSTLLIPENFPDFPLSNRGILIAKPCVFNVLQTEFP
jgi:hypothetical protein